MGIGTGIFIFVVGAIAEFALNFKVGAVNMNLIGGLLMGAGALVFLISLFSDFKKRSTSTSTRTAINPDRTEKVTEKETKSDEL